MSTSHVSVETLSKAEVSCNSSRIRDHDQRVSEPITCANVANSLLMYGKVTIGHEFICPLLQMILEDHVSFGGVVYERKFVEGYVKDLFFRVLIRQNVMFVIL